MSSKPERLNPNNPEFSDPHDKQDNVPPTNLVERCAKAAASTITGPDYWHFVALVVLREAGVADMAMALETFVEAFSERLDAWESNRKEWDQPPLQDNDDAGDIYNWALTLTIGDLRRARAALTRYRIGRTRWLNL